jgi:hypothetical protein
MCQQLSNQRLQELREELLLEGETEGLWAEIDVEEALAVINELLAHRAARRKQRAA